MKINKGSNYLKFINSNFTLWLLSLLFASFLPWLYSTVSGNVEEERKLNTEKFELRAEIVNRYMQWDLYTEDKYLIDELPVFKVKGMLILTQRENSAYAIFPTFEKFKPRTLISLLLELSSKSNNDSETISNILKIIQDPTKDEDLNVLALKKMLKPYFEDLRTESN